MSDSDDEDEYLTYRQYNYLVTITNQGVGPNEDGYTSGYISDEIIGVEDVALQYWWMWRHAVSNDDVHYFPHSVFESMVYIATVLNNWTPVQGIECYFNPDLFFVVLGMVRIRNIEQLLPLDLNFQRVFDGMEDLMG